MPDVIRTEFALRNKRTKKVTQTFGTKEVMQSFLLQHKARFGSFPLNAETVKLITTVEIVQL